ncbi:hypothetical protein PR003_g28263 [Phytophthora rubi]|uniref:Uncharacterized protein n=1 Tax=Phytophthora rubi TaxID=129364 RepID=A0A6A4BT87_9STRA|nr:hypothetical protein PR001_g27199 [Phytophthora rubi]KAE9279306.1 hypothetical protein PR003_g28263 [Phytophthora rubi]
MQAYFRRFRALRGKGVKGVAHDSLQRSWCAMITRWNLMLRANASFVDWLEAREDVVGNYSLRDLRVRVCTNAWNAERTCYVQVREGCAVCGSSGNLSEADCQREAEQAWIAKYRRVLVDVSMSSSRGGAYLRPRVVARVLGRRKVGDSRVLARDLVLELAINVRNIPEESGAWLPCIVVRWKAKPTHSVTPRGRNPARGRTTRTDTAQGDLEEAANRAWDAQAEAEAATTQVVQARTELEAARQSNRELLARTRERERRVFGAPQAAAQPRQSAARTARREDRSLYAPVPEGSSSTG